jgi:hypothetical protein
MLTPGGACAPSSSWRPYYAEYIVEAYTMGVIQQIAKLSTQVGFWDNGWCTYSFSNCYSPLSSGLSSTTYQLAQNQASYWWLGSCGWFCNWVDNTNQAVITGTGGMYGWYESGIPTVTWVTSSFNYNVAH